MMNNKEFIAALRKAKVIAREMHKHKDCLLHACLLENILLGVNAVFGEGTKYEHRSVRWVRETKPTKADIARVFNESIKALEGK